MPKKTTKKKPVKKPSKPKMQTFPPRFSTRGVRITGFQVEIWNHTPFVYEDKERTNERT